MNNCFIILAAGKSNRFLSKTPKPFIQYNGDILIKHSINKAILSRKFSKIVIAINKNHRKYIKKLKLNKVRFVNGGKTRADSARNCLNYIKKYKPKMCLSMTLQDQIFRLI
jgi:4-diphosphocytidyl-2-methyl-D-erithritol synthase